MCNSNYHEYRVQSTEYRVQSKKHIINNGFRKLLLPIVIMLFAYFSNVEAIAQCPPGYTLKTDTITINGCDYEINVCVNCAIGPLPAEVRLQEINKIPTSPPCEQTWNAGEVINYVYNYLHIFVHIYSYICDPLLVPPCPEQSSIYTVNHWVCYYIERFLYFGKDHIKYRACDYDNYCYESFTYCFDPLPPPNGSYIKNMITPPTMHGTVNCTLEASEVYEPTWYGSTPCFIYHTPCNP